MADKNTPEVVDRDLELAPQQNLATLDANQAKFDAIIRFSQQTEKLGFALDNIRKFVLGRALPGDWVQFGNKIEMSGAACERVLSALGLMGVEASFTDWKYWKDTGTDKSGDWFTWFYEANVKIGGLLIEKVQGRAGSRDKFFGYKDSAWKDLSDVKEADIRMAARRGVIKEGVKVALGLRNVPVESASSIGLDPKKIKVVEFGDRDSKAAAEATAPDKDGGLRGVLKDIKDRDGKSRTSGQPFKVYTLILDNGAVAETFDSKFNDAGKKLIGKRVVMMTTPNKNPKYAPNLTELHEDTEPAKAEAGDAQEPPNE